MKSIKKVLVFVFLFAFAIFLTACGGSKGKKKTQDTTTQKLNKDLISISASYKDSTYDFNTTVNIVYDETLVFNQSDFIFTAGYSDSSTEQVTPSSFGVYNSNDQLVQSNYTPGMYLIKFGYSGLNSSVVFNINPADITNAEITGINRTYDYTGTAIHPVPVVTYNNKTLVEDVDYFVGYGDNIINTGIVVISGTGSYEGTKAITFSIGTLDPVVPNFTDVEYDYNGTDRMADVCKRAEDLTTEGITYIDYVISKGDQTVAEIVNAGTYHVVASYIVSDGYKQASASEFDVTINKLSIATATTSEIVFYYTGTYPTPDDLWDFTVTLNNVELGYLTDFEVTANTGEGIDNINASTGTTHGSLVVSGVNNYTGEKIVDFNILQCSVSNSINIDYSIGVTYYKGSEHYVTINGITDIFNNNNLVEGTDYTLSYSNNIEVGEATLTISGKGNYNGSYPISFQIYAKELTIDEVTWSNASIEYTGEELINDIYINNLPDGVEATYSFYSENNGRVNVNSIIEPGNYSCDFTLALKNTNDAYGYSYSNNYYINYTYSTYHDFIVTKKAATVYIDSTIDTRIVDKGDSNIHYNYSGSAIMPIIQVKVGNDIIPSNQYTVATKILVEIQIDVSTWTYEWQECNAINVSDQYAFYVESDHYTFTNLINNDYMYFTIEKIEATNEQKAQITWPTVKYYVFTNNYELSNNGSVGFITNADEYRFRLINSYGVISIVLEMTNYENITKNSDINYSYDNVVFDSFSVNGTALNPTQINNYDPTFGDKIEIAMNSGYYVSLSSLSSEKESSLTFFAGIGQNNENLSSFTIYVFEGDSEFPRGNLYYVNIEDVFTTFEIDELSQLNINEFEIHPSDNSDVTISLKSGYYARYSYSTNGVDETIKVDKTNSLSTKFLDSEGTGYIDIFKGEDTNYFLRIVLFIPRYSVALDNPYTNEEVVIGEDDLYWYYITDLVHHEIDFNQKYMEGIYFAIEVDNNLSKAIKISAIINGELAMYSVVEAGQLGIMNNIRLSGNLVIKLEDADAEDLKSTLTIACSTSEDTETLKNEIHVYDNSTNEELVDGTKIEVGQQLRIVVDNRASKTTLVVRNDGDEVANNSYNQLIGSNTNEPIIITVAGDVYIDLDVIKPDRTITIINTFDVGLEVYYLSDDDEPVEIPVSNNQVIPNHTELCARVTNNTTTEYLLVVYVNEAVDISVNVSANDVTNQDAIFADSDLTIKIEEKN